jgi:hypothetical protein
MARAVEALRDELDDAYLNLLTRGSAQCVLEGRDLPELPPAPATAREQRKEKKGWFAKMRGR